MCATCALLIHERHTSNIEQIARRPVGGSTTGVVHQRPLEKTMEYPHSVSLASTEGQILGSGHTSHGVCAHCHYWHENREGIRRTTKQPSYKIGTQGVLSISSFLCVSAGSRTAVEGFKPSEGARASRSVVCRLIGTGWNARRAYQGDESQNPPA